MPAQTTTVPHGERNLHLRLWSPILLLALISLFVWVIWGMYRVGRQEQRNDALIAAIKQGDTNAVRSLLDDGAAPNAVNHSVRHVSGWQFFLQSFRRMIGKASRPPAQGDSALLLAANAAEVRPAIIMDLLDKGANVHAQDQYGETALLALIDARSLPDAPDIAVVPAENPLLVKALLNHGVDYNARDFSGETALMIGAQNGWTKTVGFLLDKGADVNAVAPDCYPGTALGDAITCGHTDIVKKLIASKANVNLPDGSGSTPLAYAKRSKSKPIIELLIKAGARR